jgi:dTDP-3-amino-3,4,6-trideoxy-alpha-D-glucose transaminase
VIHTGARPKYADVLESTANVDVSTIEPHLTSRTKAIIVIHMYGHPVDMDPVLELARARGLYVIEDAAHALGGSYKGRPLGSLSDISFASFARKCVSVAGQGGMSFTSHPEWATAMYQYRRHGWNPADAYRSTVGRIGYNFTLNESNAAVGRVSLKRLEAHNAARARNADAYTRSIAARGLPLRPFDVMPWAKSGWLHYVVRAPRRDELVAALERDGIEASVHYRDPVYRLAVFLARTGDDPGPRPVTDRLAREIVSLPSHPDMGARDLDAVLDAVATFYRANPA